MSVELFGRTLLAVHGPEPAAVGEWNQYVVDSNSAEVTGVLVVVDRSYPGPTALQRAQANAAAKYHNRYPPIAVVTASILHRGIVTVFSWMQKGNILAYSPAQLSAAMDYAGIGATLRVSALSRVHALARRVGSSWIQESMTL